MLLCKRFPFVCRTVDVIRFYKHQSALRQGYLRSHSDSRFVTRAMTAGTQAAEQKPPVHEFRRLDYKPPPYTCTKLDLHFVLNEDISHVTAAMHFVPQIESAIGPTPPLVLDGRADVKLASLKLNGQAVPSSAYTVTDKALTLTGLPTEEFDLEVGTDIKPQENTLLEGLYKSSGNFCTQCEAEGFRGITYFQDRPDVMARYTTRIEADKKLYPVLLSNGNLQEQGDLPDGRHYAVWVDPFPKPSYLFALVAGNLSMKEGKFTTVSGREVALRIFVAEKDLPKVDYALDSLHRAMRWDEEAFGREYDLDLFNIVAVDDFNMGAMENKSLNIFNSRLVMASPATATDFDYRQIERVVGHEYFHNWTGNRVTCRDWFQLTLKEGLTVYRDQEFTADMRSRSVQRIFDAITLRTVQYTEDAGPTAHPVRPDHYIKMENFYTVTVYKKGAEVVRLYRTLLGVDGFRKGMDLYFQRHDGQAVTCDDFLAAMADANGVQLESLRRWYSQAGTPQVTVSTSYDAAKQTFTLKASQTVPPTPGQEVKQPVLIPLAVGLLGPDGQDLPLRLQGQAEELGTTAVLRLEEAEQQWVFTGVGVEPVPSVLRNFSAPVKLTVEGQTEAQLQLMFAHDSDPFNRWEAGQRLSKSLLLHLYKAAQDPSQGASLEERLAAAGGVSPGLVDAFRSVLTAGLDKSFTAMAITLPASSELVDDIPEADPVLLYQIRTYVTKQLAAQLRPELEAAVKANDSPTMEVYSPDAASAGRRELKNRALQLLAALQDPEITAQCLRRFREAGNMTDQIAALSALVDTVGEAREAALTEFYEQWKKEPLVILKWLTIQASADVTGNLKGIKAIEANPEAFNIKNPNNCYSLYLGFARSPVNFHANDGSGYNFIADAAIKLSDINHQVSARVTGALSTWRRYDPERQAMMKGALERILAHQGLCENSFEIAARCLGRA